jgi:chemotaxis protein methyltransferase WspC
MSIARFEDLLERTMGLNAASIGTSAVARALDARMRARTVESQDAYWDLLLRSREELQHLIETVVVPETWFFRDPQAFPAMTAAALQFRGKDMSRPLRLLSLPCSTGEEPYTMAMALLDAGLPAGGFRIDAIDISAVSLARARAGIFGRNSFRGHNLGFRDRHFVPAERGFRINDAVRDPVQFHQGNMLGEGFLADAEAYDVIFCRNLLIYFDAPTQTRAIAVLKRLLAPHGMLFVGHSEAGLMTAGGLVSAKIPMAFAFRKAAAQAGAPATPVAIPPSPHRAKPPLDLKAPRPRRPVRSALAPSAAASPTPSPPPPLQSIEDLRRMADGGRLDEAARGVETHLRERGPSAEALLLLGLISDARGDAAAALRHYRKALYLEPANGEALGHLALLLKRQGDHAGARLIDERLRRRDERSVS